MDGPVLLVGPRSHPGRRGLPVTTVSPPPTLRQQSVLVTGHSSLLPSVRGVPSLCGVEDVDSGIDLSGRSGRR